MASMRNGRGRARETIDLIGACARILEEIRPANGQSHLLSAVRREVDPVHGEDKHPTG